MVAERDQKPRRISVGVIDSGGPAAETPGGRRFLREGGSAEAMPDALGHGSAVSAILHRAYASVQVIHAQVFRDRPVTTPAQVAAALAWLNAEGMDVICLSLGLANDRAPLRDAVAEAVSAGRIIVAATPAQGAPCYPAAYPGVIAATGDARCAWADISEPKQGVIGAWCGSPEQGHSGQGGASMATARVAGHLAARLAAGESFENGEAARAALLADACFRGREFRGAPA